MKNNKTLIPILSFFLALGLSIAVLFAAYVPSKSLNKAKNLIITRGIIFPDKY